MSDSTSPMIQPSQTTRDRNARACVVAESRAYQDASNVVDAAGYAFEPPRTIAPIVEAAECNASEQASARLIAHSNMLAGKPGRAFVLAASRTPRRNTKSERREATRLSSRIPYVARRNDACGVQPRGDRTSERSISRWLPYPRGRRRRCWVACLQGVAPEPACSQPGRETHVWAGGCRAQQLVCFRDGWP